uniref:helix-turn-helix domain-containing protein n=1 Tax=Burkholderia gladioli TaxID=28095 RepID=UPI0021B48C1A|nr:helix-turn-helix domain-containing protein [Burkholderia gladioli]
MVGDRQDGAATAAPSDKKLGKITSTKVGSIYPTLTDISRGVSAGLSIRAIARQLNRAPSTISREIGRNGGTDHYRALEADERALQATLRPKCCLLEQNRRLRYAVERKLCREWSPEQVSGWLKNRYPDDEAMRVFHETIYRSLFVQTRGVLKKELQYHLRTQRKMRHSRSSSTKGARNKRRFHKGCSTRRRVFQQIRQQPSLRNAP